MRKLKLPHLYNILPEAFIFALKQRRSRKFKAVFNLHLPKEPSVGSKRGLGR